MKKGIIIILCLVLVAALGCSGWFGYQYYEDLQLQKLEQAEYLASHVTIDGTDYDISLTELDLSGSPLTDWRGLERIAGLRQLDIRDTGISSDDYNSIRAMLPDCQIIWSVPFQGDFLSENTSVLTVSTLDAQDVQQLSYLPRLTQVNAEGCRDYEALRQLTALYPNIAVTYDVEVGGQAIPGNATELTMENPDLSQLEAALPYLPQLELVHLTGSLPEPAEVAEVQRRMPQVGLDFTFTAFDRVWSSLDTFIDLSNISMKDTQEVEKIIPYFRDLQQIDMLNCGLPNKTMDALNKRWPDTKIVWQVYLYGAPFRTDAKYLFPGKYSVKQVSSGSIQDIRYCTDMEMVDLGHYGISDISFVEYLPNLQYLLLCQIDNHCDLTPLSKCKNLKYLEIFGDNLTDLWPLTNLSNLEDFNLCDSPVTWRQASLFAEYGPLDDVSALREMTGLNRLWMSNVAVGKEGRNALLERHQNTFCKFIGYSATGSGWRHCPNYYDMRDLSGMIYFVS